jgi:hypothetical protein
MLDKLRKEGYVVKFGWLDKQCAGLIDLERRTITINLDLYIVSTFLHEFFHFSYPTLGEPAIRRKERKAVEKMTVLGIKNLAKAIRKEVERGQRIAYNPRGVHFWPKHGLQGL